ncbi:Glucose-repressible alcohol dehydrogenase transcriptional effector-like protein [Hapsidospora chrysogenum ATCC 11550]|uniref:CCR4-Not complex 3'-5'-exoribonuclease subunit Ccr4 n=1 Tax=Hapsidospora chrysogenum (strain ATCC 11550 / CBS 779.69 / DSM 880 / IAM 14645 / JCM 23072 / IMI 49137) TaxID=857340 RepID=A0A086STE3_HAPC1|nr:Glucose-repressible alcohol dehydrogenase transcriptional effector-like protein [Hapsidospora chrysogenum ATCC 11550]
MYSQNHQQSHNARLNGAGRAMPNLLYSFQQHAQHHQHPSQNQHHQGLPDHGISSTNGLGPRGNFPSGVLSNSTPFNTSLQNGHNATSRAGQPPPNEMWSEQLRLHQDAEQAHRAMTDQQQPHYYARLKASENKGIGGPPPASVKTQADNENTLADRRRPYDEEMKRQDWHNMDMSGQGLRNLASELFRYQFLNELYIASNKLTRLPKQIGELRQLRHLDASFNQISELPPELGMCTYLKQLLLFNNDIRQLPYELGSLHLLEMLGIEGNPLDDDIKHEIMQKGTKNLINALKETAPIPPPPAPRQEIVVQEDVSPNLERIKVFSWNILCDKYATSQTYGYTPTAALNWAYRRDCILEELRERDADFLALQEVSTDAFKEDLSPPLAHMDYKGVHWPKSRAKTMSERDAQSVDGCAVFYKQSKFILLDKQLIEFAAIAINRPDMKNQHDVFNRVMPKDNIAVICFFESRLTGARIILVNAHLTWDVALADVKVIQTGILMEHVTKLAEKYSRWPAVKDKKMITVPPADGSATPPPQAEPGPSQEYRTNTEIPLLVCGDFNSTEDSSVYDLLTKGRVSPDHPELSNYQYGSFTRDGIEHPFSLRDAYAHTKRTADELPFTNYTPGFTDTIDYIWYSTNSLEVVSVLGPPDAGYLTRIPAFPYWHFPADHIQIMSEFVIKGRKEKKLLPEREVDFGSGGGSSR